LGYGFRALVAPSISSVVVKIIRNAEKRTLYKLSRLFSKQALLQIPNHFRQVVYHKVRGHPAAKGISGPQAKRTGITGKQYGLELNGPGRRDIVAHIVADIGCTVGGDPHPLQTFRCFEKKAG
jgi:hypothetical protein